MLIEILEELHPHACEDSKTICSHLNYSLLMGRNTQSVPYIIDCMGQKEFLTGLRELVALKLVNSTLRRNYAEIRLNTKTIEELGYDLEEMVYSFKLSKYSLVKNNPKDHTPMVKVGNSYRNTQIDVKVLNRSHTHDFGFDIEMLNKYFRPIVKSLIVKKIKEKGEEYVFEKSYESLIVDVLRQYIHNQNGIYNLGGCNFDQRYRTISLQLDKVLNPVGYTIGRALLKISPRLICLDDISAINAIYMFIATMNNSCIGLTSEQKIKFGKKCFDENMLPNDIDLLIWCERLYAELTNLYADGKVMCLTPIELDASFSAKLISSVVLGDYDGIDNCNGIKCQIISDPWFIENVERKLGKKLTARIYGSEKSIKALAGSDFDFLTPSELKKQIKLVERAERSGSFKNLMTLKELFKCADIKTEEYRVNMIELSYDVKILKSKAVDTVRTRYFTEVNGVLKMFKNTKVLTTFDSKQHKNYLPTGFIHGLDWKPSKRGFMELEKATKLDGVERVAFHIHDAVVLHPLDAHLFREGVRLELVDMYENGHMYLTDYLESIGLIVDGKFTNIKALKLYKELLKARKEFDSDLLTGYCYK